MPWTFAPAAALGLQRSRRAGSHGRCATSSGTPTAPDCLSTECGQGTSNQPPCGTTCEASTGDLGLASWISSLGESPVSPTPAPASSGGRPTSAIFGPISGGCLAKYDRGSRSLRTFAASLFTEEGCSEFSESLPRTGGMLSGGLYRLRMWEPIIGGSGSGLLPTPAAHQAGSNTCGRAKGETFRDRYIAHTLPTPRAEERQQHNSQDGYMALSAAARLLPTPQARDGAKMAPGKGCQERGGHQSSLPAQLGGSLNPDFVAWMMGWPLRWLSLPAPTGGPPGRRGRASRPSPPESPSAPTSSEPSATAGCLMWRLTLRDAFRRGWTAAMTERQAQPPLFAGAETAAMEAVT